MDESQTLKVLPVFQWDVISIPFRKSDYLSVVGTSVSSGHRGRPDIKSSFTHVGETHRQDRPVEPLPATVGCTPDPNDDSELLRLWSGHDSTTSWTDRKPYHQSRKTMSLPYPGSIRHSSRRTVSELTPTVILVDEPWRDDTREGSKSRSRLPLSRRTCYVGRRRTDTRHDSDLFRSFPVSVSEDPSSLPVSPRRRVLVVRSPRFDIISVNKNRRGSKSSLDLRRT